MISPNARSLPVWSACLVATLACEPKVQPGPNGGPQPGPLNNQYAQTFSTAQDFNSGTLYGVTAVANQQLEIASNLTTFQTPYLWVPNSTDDTVSQIDTGEGAGSTGEKLIGTYPLTSAGETCVNPSRTTVDVNFDVWVGCRGTDSYCHGCSGLPLVDDKIMKVSHSTGEVLLSVHVGNAPRGLALDSNNHLWVAMSADDTVWELDGQTGQCYRGNGCPQPAIALSEGALGFPYGAVIDSYGYMWIQNHGSLVGGVDTLDQIDTSTGSIVGSYGPFPRAMPDGTMCAFQYGITVDELGNIWMGGWTCNDAIKVQGAHPPAGGAPTGTLLGAFQTGGKKARGIAPDLHGNIWVGDFDTSTASKLNNSDGTVITSQTVATGPIGVEPDALGHLWAVGYMDGVVTKLNGADYSVMAQIQVGNNPYTYSDMLGLILHYITLHNNNVAWWDGVVDAGSAVQFTEVSWEAEVPQSTNLTVRTRCAQTTAGLQTTPFSPETNASPATVSCGGAARYLEIEVRFYATGTTASPVLHDVSAHWTG
jgi:hypothetical protein